ncbi:hypothetical protein HMPREF1991_02762 [Hoylesella loescheii DSM 19665 = JCM 12249 = ATCC 15930]|uniref:Uncharacterized protein n=1 Tax=Hoylesella loescheii DSM 19665 = JCM 12249 = ATCC 15930 TaxID=1122985 RepID=A0A069QGR6_HOYLO|nr:hypothetical protein HMPREF1991_02762 [Hoylesella loescheii DSM 19665 = JCM 12249 = ATCC 15930]
MAQDLKSCFDLSLYANLRWNKQETDMRFGIGYPPRFDYVWQTVCYLDIGFNNAYEQRFLINGAVQRRLYGDYKLLVVTLQTSGSGTTICL